MSSAAIITQLEEQLQQQELLITALTTSLEQTANELDRTKRDLVEKPQPKHAHTETNYENYEAPPMDLQVLEEQHTITHELRECVQQFQSMQPGMTLERIEEQLQEIRDLVQGLASNPAPAPVMLPEDWKASLAIQMQRQGHDPFASILGSATQQSAQPEPSVAKIHEPEEATAPEPEPEEPAEKPQPQPTICETHKETPILERMPALPEEIDLENATPEELRAAISSRDECIQKLTDYVQAINTVEIPMFDLKDYDSLPEEQRHKLEAWEAVLRENIRRAEVELSVERAQQGREIQKLQQQQMQLAKERKRMALLQKTLKPQTRTKPEEDEAGQKKSWLNLLRWGANGEHGEEEDHDEESAD